MARISNPQITLRDVYRTVFRHRCKVLGCFLAVVTLVAALTLASPRQYISSAKLYVRLGRENATLDPTATIGQGSVVAVPPSREAEILTAVELLKSPVVAEAVVDALGPGKILPSWRPAQGLQAAGSGAEREEASQWLSDHLDVQPVRKSNVIVLRYVADDPGAAQRILAALIDAYLQHHVRVNRPEGTHEFLAEQAARTQQQLLEAEARLRDAKSEAGLSDPVEQRRLMTERVLRLEDELAETKRQIAATSVEIGQLDQLLATLPRTEVRGVTSGIGNRGAEGMRQQLYTLQLREQELAAKYTDAHPQMQRIRQEVAAAEAILNAEQPTRREITTEPDPAYTQVQLRLLKQEPLLASLKEQAAGLEAELADARSQLKVFNAHVLRVAQLQREVDLYDSEYRTYKANLEQSRIDRALQLERISNISVAQPATFQPAPVRPQVWLNLVLGAVAGLLGGLLLAGIAEHLDHSFKAPEEIEQRLDLPVLVTVPRLRSRGFLINGRN